MILCVITDYYHTLPCCLCNLGGIYCLHMTLRYCVGSRSIYGIDGIYTEFKGDYYKPYSCIDRVKKT